MRSLLVICTRSPTPVMIIIAAHHTAPAHHETSKHDSPIETKIKVKQPKYFGFKFKPLQVNDSSQSNQKTDHLISQLCYMKGSAKTMLLQCVVQFL
jgi:hypothetical protein